MHGGLAAMQGMQYGMMPQFYSNPIYHPPPYHTPQAFQPPIPQALPPPFNGGVDIPMPSIPDWLAHLDRNPARIRPDAGTTFAALAGNFSGLGFCSLTQLIVDPSVASAFDMCKMLDIKPGIGLSLLTCAKQDLDAIRSGQLTIPAVAGQVTSNE
jgi:hypothetical protein